MAMSLGRTPFELSVGGKQRGGNGGRDGAVMTPFVDWYVCRCFPTVPGVGVGDKIFMDRVVCSPLIACVGIRTQREVLWTLTPRSH